MNTLDKLRIKFGLAFSEPTSEQAQEWADRTRAYIDAGNSPELAGRTAAQEVFSTYGKVKYASQADTIYDLLMDLQDG